MTDALESITDGVILFDADDRMVMCNSAYMETTEGYTDIIKPGVKMEAVVRASAKKYIAENSDEDLENYVHRVPIRLSPIPTTSRVLPIPRVKLGLGRAAISPAMSSAS